MGPPPPNCQHLFQDSLFEGGLLGFTPGPVAALPPEAESDPVAWCRKLARAHSGPDEAELTPDPALPGGRWLWHEIPKGEKVPKPLLPPLSSALVLGRCGPVHNDEHSPTVWTRSRLLRRVRLYRVDGWYDPE